MKLTEFAEVLREGKDGKFSSSYDIELNLTDHPPPQLLKQLAKLQRIGLLNGDALMSIIAQAPIDPLNLFAAIHQMSPGEWAFSAIDFGVVRVLARDANSNVAAAVRIDLMDSSVTTLVVNQAGQLTTFQRYEPDGTKILEKIQTMCDQAIHAAVRERPARKTR